MESLFLLAFGEEEFFIAFAMACSEAFFNKLLVEPLPARDLFLCEDSDGYAAAVRASKRKGVHLFRVVAFLTVGKTREELLLALATNRQNAVTTARKWATEERALLN
jgi:hypothetical protein